MKRVRQNCAALLAALFLITALPLPALAEGVESEHPAVQQESHSQLETTDLEEATDLTVTPAPIPATEAEETPAPVPDLVPTTEPEQTPVLVPTPEPEQTPAPVPATEPEQSPAPVPATEPEQTPAPVPATEPEQTSATVPTTEPEQTPAPVPTTEPEQTPAPVPTVEPEQTPAPSPAETENPDVLDPIEIAPYSLIPLETTNISFLSLADDHLPAERACMPVGDIIQKVDEYLINEGKLTAGQSILQDGAQVMWTVGYGSDEYQVSSKEDTIDLMEYIDDWGSVNNLELIIGPADQLNQSNKRYKITELHLPGERPDVLDFTVYTAAEPKNQINVEEQYFDYESSSIEENEFYIYLDPRSGWKSGDQACLNMALKSVYSGRYEAVVYEGAYKTEEAAKEAGASDITSQIFRPEHSSTSPFGYMSDFRSSSDQSKIPYVTVVLKRGAAVQVIPFRISLHENSNNVDFFNGLWSAERKRVTNFIYSNTSTSIELQYPVNGKYYLGMEFEDVLQTGTAADQGLSSVSRAVLGNYETAEQVNSWPDIKSDLFSDPETKGYLADFSQVDEKGYLWFTILGTNGKLYHISCGLSHDDEYYIDFNDLYVDSATGSRTDVADYSFPNKEGDGVTVTLKTGYAPNMKYYLGLSFSRGYYGTPSDYGLSNMSRAVYGHYETVEEVNAQPDIKAELFSDPETAGYLADFSASTSLEFTVADLAGNIHHFKVQLSAQPGYVQVEGIYADGQPARSNAGSNLPAPVGRRGLLTVKLYRTYPGNGQYYVGLSFYDGQTGAASASSVSRAVDGSFKTAEEVNAQPDIKDQLFSDASAPGGGYLTDFGLSENNSASFTILGTDNQVYPVEIRLEESVLSDKVNLEMKSAQDVSGNEYKVYLMREEDDSYYRNGYQTVFLLKENGDTEAGTSAVPVTDGQIVPIFTADDGTNIYASINGGTSASQTSKETSVGFQSGQVIQYSTSAENQENADNYWITFVTQEQGPKLFVNAVNYTGHHNAQDQPVREIFLDETHNYHDIFLSNIGDAPLSGLSVSLSEDAQNIALDEYWTIGATKTLAPFTTTEDYSSYSYASQLRGELYNVAKIRLVPSKNPETGEVESGPISGTLTISADGQDPVTIQLTGVNGIPKMMTSSNLNPAVKYVPYSTFLQTNAMYGTLKLELAGGKLPEGVELRPNGEIYGVPKEVGEFQFTVKISYNPSSIKDYEFFDKEDLIREYSSTAQFTLSVLDNTDENVEKENEGEGGYRLEVKVPDITDYQDREFQSEGAFKDFVGFWLDGKKLALGEDYDAEEGSTRITVHGKTFKKAGEGKHTIAAEFRQDKSDNNPLRRTAQNYTLTLPNNNNNRPSTPVNPGNTTSGGDHDREHSSVVVSPGRKPTPSPTPAPTPEPVPTSIFQDVSPSSWCYPDVEWAYENGLMLGTGSGKFSPEAPISQSMVVTVLARLAGADLDPSGSAAGNGVPAGQWYSGAASWAKENGIVQDREGESFQPNLILSRSWLAQLLVRYLDSLKIPYTLPESPVSFSDQASMSPEDVKAFQILYHLGIFKGKGDGLMDPGASTTRAELAALLHRLSALSQNS